MKYLTLLLAFFTTACSGVSISPPDMKGMSMHANAGQGYLDSLKVAQNAPLYACEWPEEYPGSDEPGAAYKESQAAAEDADCHEDE